MDLETAVAHSAGFATGPGAPRPKCRIEDDPADHPSIPDGLATRPDDLAFHRRAAAEYEIHLLAADARFQVEQGVGVRVDPAAARLAFPNRCSL